jgi:hypothetical protein
VTLSTTIEGGRDTESVVSIDVLLLVRDAMGVPNPNKPFFIISRFVVLVVFAALSICVGVYVEW